MALIKKDNISNIKEDMDFKDHVTAQIIFKDIKNSDEQRLEALNYLLETQTISHILKIVNNLFSLNLVRNHIFIDTIFNSFTNTHRDKSEEDFRELLNTLKNDNVYLRNACIKYLQESDEDAVVFIEKLLQDPNKDIRIFAVNILGDVRYDKSVEILRYFIAREEDVNAMMTAVDYLGEIGSEEDIELLESVKKSHSDDLYVNFGVDMAIDRIKG
ncbi:MAG: HEAT repeat domain-containing protein [Campylobacterota bacterium]|nr:HEAT repeat domain-containing protein [Campylobacterota bacterium]